MKGTLIISLDYELMWGCHDWSSVDCYGKTNIANVPVIIGRLLDLFQRYRVHATFATVGMIMANNKEELKSYCPSLKPSYLDTSKSTYKHVDFDIIEGKVEPLFLQPDIVTRIFETDGMEVGTHTFSHYFCWEPGQTIDQFEQDIIQAKRIASTKGIDINSIVFPKNNVSDDCLRICKNHGITSYRGNAKRFFSRHKSKFGRLYNRIMRLIDCYFNIGGFSSYKFETVKQKPEHPLNIPASRMFRPYSPKLATLEPLRMRRIKEELIHAAKYGEVYHIWWHPHNFGSNIEQNLSNLEDFLRCYDECHNKYGMESKNMGEFAKEKMR